jgi:hypothetical protein
MPPQELSSSPSVDFVTGDAFMDDGSWALSG